MLLHALFYKKNLSFDSDCDFVDFSILEQFSIVNEKLSSEPTFTNSSRLSRGYLSTKILTENTYYLNILEKDWK